MDTVTIAFNKIGTITNLSTGTDAGHAFFEEMLPKVCTALALGSMPFTYDPVHRQITTNAGKFSVTDAMEESNIDFVTVYEVFT
jgi:hypothetical protein